VANNSSHGHFLIGVLIIILLLWAYGLNIRQDKIVRVLCEDRVAPDTLYMQTWVVADSICSALPITTFVKEGVSGISKNSDSIQTGPSN
jgi:hypothetical protein